MVVRQPFLMSRDYARYADALEKLFWLETVVEVRRAAGRGDPGEL
jgi:hypothetical protein